MSLSLLLLISSRVALKHLGWVEKQLTTHQEGDSFVSAPGDNPLAVRRGGPDFARTQKLAHLETPAQFDPARTIAFRERYGDTRRVKYGLPHISCPHHH